MMKTKFPISMGLLFLLNENLAHASDSSHGINWWHLGAAYSDAPALGWLSITFMIFVFLVVRSVKKPLSLYLETRSHDIKRQIEEGQQAKIESEQKLQVYEEKLRTLGHEIEQLKATFMKQAGVERVEKERLARINEARIMRDADDTIKSNFERSKNRLAHEVIEKAMLQAQKIIIETKKDQIDQVLQDQLIKDFKMSPKELCQ